MLVILFYVVNYRTCYLNFSKQVEVPENEENLCRLLELVSCVILEHKKVIVFINVLGDNSLCLRILYAEVRLPLSVSVRKKVKTDLNNHQGKVYISDFVIQPL